MKCMIQTITDNYNAFVGTVIAIISVIFGEHWYLFVLFFVLSIADWVTGWMKSKITKKENSVKGWQGVFEKIGYRITIMFTFMVIAGLTEIDEIIGVDLQITTLLGWLVLASLIMSGVRSICENFVEAGFNVPRVLSNDLAVADKLINKESKDKR